MSEYLFVNNNYFLFSLTFVTFSLLIYIFKNKFPNFFGVCESNEKTSFKHDKILRGFGIFYLIILPSYLIFFENILELNDLILLFLTCIIGFLDDKKGLSQVFKVSLLTLIVIIYLLIDESNFLTFESFFELTSMTIYFIFLVLFFNQIDGINGLAAITFLITILLLFIISPFLIAVLPIAGAVTSYLLINLYGKSGIQGEAGSFFMGAFIFVISLDKNFQLHYSFPILLLLPILLDVICTTLVRIYFKKNILEGHRSNLYQKLVAQYRSPSIVSLTFGGIQLIIGYLLINSLDQYPNEYVYIFLILTIIFISFVFVKISFLIHENKILRK